jgi:hypothetical protein
MKFFAYVNLTNPYKNSLRQVYDKSISLSGHPRNVSKLTSTTTSISPSLHCQHEATVNSGEKGNKSKCRQTVTFHQQNQKE